MEKYNKFIIALVGAAVAAASVLFSDAEWLPIVVSFLTAIGVYQVPNKSR